MRNRVWIGLTLFPFLLFGRVLMGQEKAKASKVSITLGKLPIYFIENRGVFPEDVGYYVQASDKTIFFSKDGITFALQGKKERWVVKFDFLDPEPGVKPQGRKKQKAVFSYFKGKPEKWKAGLPTFGEVVYRGLWPGIDLVYSGTVNQLKYEFRVAPGADPGRIRFSLRGTTGVHLTERGSLRVETPVGSLEDAPPIAFQEIDGKGVEVAMEYSLSGSPEEGFTVGFDLGSYDPARPLILDPAFLVYCGYIGGSKNEYAFGVAVDSSGNAYVAGYTRSTEQTFPVKAGPDPTYNSGYSDAFVAKVNASGTSLVYCGYIGGSNNEVGFGIAVDISGNAYVSGGTSSTEQTFPVKVGPNLKYNGGYSDAFVAKVNALGTSLVYCGYIGGSGYENGRGIALDSSGNAYVAGETSSTEQTFPVKVGPDLTYNGGNYDGFVAKVNAGGKGLVYCGYIGGSSYDYVYGIAVGASGNAYVTGKTDSTERTFPVKVGPDLTYNQGLQIKPCDAFVAKVNRGGTGLVYCGYIGGSSNENGEGIAVDSSGNAYVTGRTRSHEMSFPVKVGPDLTYNGILVNAFVAKVNARGTGLVYCGYIGGSGFDYGYSIAVDSWGNACVAGETTSTEQTFPVKVGPGLIHQGGSLINPFDAFVAKVNAGGTGLVYCGYIGGYGDDCGEGIALDSSGNVYVTGAAGSTEKTFPVKVGPDLTFNGGQQILFEEPSDVFVAKVALTLLEGNKTKVRHGGTVDFTLTASDGPGLYYLMASSLGTGPILFGKRKLGLSLDILFTLSIGANNSIFTRFLGKISNKGVAGARFLVPNDSVLAGLKIHNAFFTVSPAAPMWVKSISETFTFTIQ